MKMVAQISEWAKSPVAQTSKSAVSQVSKPALRPSVQTPADWPGSFSPSVTSKPLVRKERAGGDTADLEICATCWGVRSTCRLFCLLFAFFGLAAGLFAQETATEEGRIRFCAVDIYVDSKATPLAAYQLEFSVTNGVAKIVGIEGGEHPAFHEPPFYDPKAMQHERVILAAFNTGKELPSRKTRVATIHLQVTRDVPLQCELKLQAAGNAAGGRIAVEANFQERKTE